MVFTKEQLSLPINFLLSMERTGSSMLTAMFNSHPEILAPTEEPFLIYFYPEYKNKKQWTEKDIDRFLLQFERLAERNLNMYLHPVSELKQSMMSLKNDLNFQTLCRLIYLHFLPLKNKSGIKQIIDKQIKYILYIDDIMEIFPSAKFLILVRDYRDVICSWKKRGVGSSPKAAYMAKMWEMSYSSALKSIKKHPEKFMIIRYENLVADTESMLRKILLFFKLEFHENMMRHYETYGNYMEKMKENVSPEFFEIISDFHSNTLTPVNKMLTGIWKTELLKRDVLVSNSISGKTACEYGYNISDNSKIKLSFSDKIGLWKAWWEKRIYLHLYIRSPFWLKVLVKKYRPNTPHYFLRDVKSNQ